MIITPGAVTIKLSRHCDTVTEFAWRRITRITARKQDLFNPKIIIIEIHLDHEVWEIDASDCDGFLHFSLILERQLAGMTPYSEWWPQVTDPSRRHESLDLYRQV